MSDTPRTGALLESILRRDRFLDNKNAPEEWVVHARQLERELAAANRKIQRLVEAGDESDELLACEIGADDTEVWACSNRSEQLWMIKEAREKWTAAKEGKAS